MSTIKPLEQSSVHRSGFSLLELIIVVTLILVVAGMAAPNLIERMRDNRLYNSADEVRQVLSEARTYAIDSGIDYQFRYEPEGQYFVVLPTEQEPTITNSVSSDAQSAEYMRLSGQLDEDFFLRTGSEDGDTSEQLQSTWFGGLPDSSTLASKGWSAPIYFHFDGSASDGLFRVMDQEGRVSELSVRGLTGAVRVSPVHREAQQ